MEMGSHFLLQRIYLTQGSNLHLLHWQSDYLLLSDLRLVTALGSEHTSVSFPGGAVVKNLPANAGDGRNKSSISELGRSHGIGSGNPLQ